MTTDQLIEEFEKKFCSLYDHPVIVKGELKDEGHLALLTDNGTEVINWLRQALTQVATHKEQEIVDELLAVCPTNDYPGCVKYIRNQIKSLTTKEK